MNRPRRIPVFFTPCFIFANWWRWAHKLSVYWQETNTKVVSELSSIYYVLWLRTKNNKLVGYNSTDLRRIWSKIQKNQGEKLRMFVSQKKLTNSLQGKLKEEKSRSKPIKNEINFQHQLILTCEKVNFFLS